MKSYYYYCYHQTKEIFFNRKRTLDGLNIVSGYMTTLLYIIYMYITTEVILYMVWMTFHLLHLQMYFIMNHESESYCTVLATCILTMLTSCVTMIIMPKGLISSTVDRDYNQALETYRISYLLFFRTCVTLFRLRPELQPSDTIYGHIHRNSIFHTTFKD